METNPTHLTHGDRLQLEREATAAAEVEAKPYLPKTAPQVISRIVEVVFRVCWNLWARKAEAAEMRINVLEIENRQLKEEIERMRQ